MTQAEADLFLALADAVAELAYNWPDLPRLKAAIVAKKQEVLKDDPTAVLAVPIEALETIG